MVVYRKSDGSLSLGSMAGLNADKAGIDSATLVSSPPAVHPVSMVVGSLSVTALVAHAFPNAAHAFTFDSPISDGCHERATVDALAMAGFPRAETPPPFDHDGRLVADFLACDVSGAKSDPWTLAAVIGVRYNDLHGEEAIDLPALSQIHSGPNAQDEHCLRGPAHDGESGDEQAVLACRAFILEQLSLAVGESDTVDLDATAEARVALAFSGPVDVPLQRYGFHLGRALHALQDGFSHTFRSEDGLRIRHVLNFAEWASSDDYSESRDGHQHLGELDDCSSGLPRARFELATIASADLVDALAIDDGGREARLARAAEVLDRYLVWEPGCGRERNYCEAPEIALAGGCSVGHVDDKSGAGSAFLSLLAAVMIGRGRRRIRRGLGKQRANVSGTRSARTLAAIWLTTALVVGSRPAHAETTPTSAADRAGLGARAKTETEAQAETVAQAETEAQVETEAPAETAAQAQTEAQVEAVAAEDPLGEEPVDFRSRSLGVVLSGSGAIDHGAAAIQIGARLELSPSFEVGLEAEWNPWFSVEAGAAVAGAFNAYGTVIFRWTRFGNLELRTSLHVGVSTLLFNMVNAESGSVGPYLGLSLLGLAIDLGDGFRFLFEPADVALPVPDVHGVPFYYRQYRLTVGIAYYP